MRRIWFALPLAVACICCACASMPGASKAAAQIAAPSGPECIRPQLTWSSAPMEVDDDVVPPRATKRCAPRYTLEAGLWRISGEVVLRLLIDEEGKVSKVEVKQGLSAGLTESSMSALEQWEFEPACYKGQPHASWLEVTFHFNAPKLEQRAGQ